MKKINSKSYKLILQFFSIFLLAFFLALPSYAEADKIKFTDPQNPILVKKSSPTFDIILQSNGTTGYSWALKTYDTDFIKPLKKKYYPATSGLIGAGGYEKWTFRVKPEGFIVPQVTSIMLIYQRPWEASGAQVTNFKVVTTDAN